MKKRFARIHRWGLSHLQRDFTLVFIALALLLVDIFSMGAITAFGASGALDGTARSSTTSSTAYGSQPVSPATYDAQPNRQHSQPTPSVANTLQPTPAATHHSQPAPTPTHGTSSSKPSTPTTPSIQKPPQRPAPTSTSLKPTSNSNHAQSTGSIDTNVTPADLAAAITADPTLVTGASYMAIPPSGTPNGVSTERLGAFPTIGAKYAVLTTGDAALADQLPGTDPGGFDDGGSNVRGNSDYDVTILAINLNVPAPNNCLQMDFSFLSQEYPQWVGTVYNDAFIAELDTTSWTTSSSTVSAPNDFALDPGGNVISVDTTGITGMNIGYAAGTAYGGATPFLTAESPITSGSHVLYLSIFDQGDHVLDSAAFVDNVRFVSVANPSSDCPVGTRFATQGAQGSERNGGNNNSMLPFCTCLAQNGDPVDGYSGNFTHTFTDFSIPSRGLPLTFSQTYNAEAAASSGSLGYGWSASAGATLAVDNSTGAVTITQENGSTVSFTPNGAGGYTAPSRVLATLMKNGDGTYTFTRLQNQTHLTFSASGQVLSETDRNGYTTTYSYNGSAQLTSITDSSGSSLSLGYDTAGHISTISDPLGRSVGFSYDGNGNLSQYTDVTGGHWTYTYDTSHHMLTMTDPRGGMVSNVYDSGGRVIKQTDAMGRVTIFAYTPPDSFGATTTTVTDPNGNITVDQYINGLLLVKTRGSGTSQAATWEYTYDSVTLGLTSVTDPNGNATTQTWDTNGNLLTSTDPLGRMTSYTYNTFNEVTSATDPLGITTTSTYDAKGNLLTTSRPLIGTNQMQTTTYTYGDSAHPGDVTAMTDPNGKVAHYTYDADGNRTHITDPLGHTTTFTYNAVGWLLSQVSPNGNATQLAGHTPAQYTTTYTYDANGDLTATVDPLGQVTTRQYDADHNLIQFTNANGAITQYAYDADNELTKTTQADGSTLTSTYDADGNQTSQTNGLGQTTTYTYDPLNRLVSMSNPLSQTTTYGYDPAGNRISLTDPAGQVMYYSYDGANELIYVSYSDGVTSAVFYSYDADGQRSSMSDGTGTTTYTYDSLHRLTSVIDGAGNAVTYSYDLKGQVTALTYPNGNTLTETYNAAGQQTGLVDWLGNTSSFLYDANGNLTEEIWANHITETFSYDANNGLDAVTFGYAQPTQARSDSTGSVPAPLPSFRYVRDTLGQVSSVHPSLMPESSQAYSYSSLNQLTSAGSVTYAYDKAGNLTQMGNATLSYNAGDELTSMSQGGATISYHYDALGNRIQATQGSQSVTYGYNQANQLVSYAASGVTAQYTYNGDGLRMSKTVNGTSEAFVWQTVGSLPLLLQDGRTSYLYGPDGLPVEQIAGNGAVTYYGHDQLGSTRLLFDASGTIVSKYAYDAYGRVTQQVGNANTPLRFAGQYQDSESGLLYLRARYYEPATAQFLTCDPLAALSKAPYNYASDNPVNASDSTGKWQWFDEHASQISVWSGRIADVTTLVSAGCDVGAWLTAGNPALLGCTIIAGALTTGADLVKLQADQIAHPGRATQDQLEVEIDIGGILAGATGATEAARLWQKAVIYGYEAFSVGTASTEFFYSFTETASNSTYPVTSISRSSPQCSN